MTQQLSEYLNVEPQALEGFGVFNGFVDLDSKLHVDPKLLPASSINEMVEAAGHMDSYFGDLMRVVEAIQEDGDEFWSDSVSLLTFPELPGVSLGYTIEGDMGRGVGRKLATRILATARKLVAAGIKDPKIFELVGLLRTNIGADRISDMVLWICRSHFYAYTQRVAEELGCEVAVFELNDVQYRLPVHPSGSDPLIFVPSDVLRDLPIAMDWSDVDLVSGHNINVRSRANEIIGASWKSVAKEMDKDDLVDMLAESPSILEDLIQKYKQRNPVGYDFDQDKLGELRWYAMSSAVAARSPLKLDSPVEWTLEHAVNLVRTMLQQVKQLVENNNLWELIHDRSERHAQRLVFGIVKSYCEANDLDVSPEANAGPGPVDFKFSRGANIVVLVETKLSTNGQMRHGYDKQIEIYNDAEKSGHSFFVVFWVGNSETPTLVSIRTDNAKSVRNGERVPELFEIDARPKDSASKRK